MTIKQLKEKRAAVVSDMRALNDEVEQRENATYSEEERARFNGWRDQITQLDERIAAAEMLEAEDARLAEARGRSTAETSETRGDDVRHQQELRTAFIAMMRGQSVAPEMREALTTSNSSVIIPKLISDQIIDNLVGQFAFLKNIDVQITTHAKTFVEPTLTGDMELKRIDITKEQDEGAATFGGIEIKAYDYRMPVIPVSITLMEGTDIDVEAAIVSLFTEHIARSLAKVALISGTGNNEITALVKGLPKSPVSAKASDAITYDDLVALRASVKMPFSSKQRGKWLMSSNTMSSLLRITDTNNRPIFIESVRDDEPDRLLGRPVIIDDTMPDIAPGKMPIIFGDLKRYRLRIVKGIRMRVYDEEKYAKNMCIGIQAFIVADGKTLTAGEAPYNALKMAGTASETRSTLK